MTKEEIIRETAAFYNSKNRSLKGYNCVYVGEKGRQCAFARCAIEPKPEWDTPNKTGEPTDVNYIVNKYADGDVDKLLKPQYQGHPIRFWLDIQGFHDKSNNWDNEGLSEAGADEERRLLDYWEGEL